MKISRTQLQKLISEAICESNSILLESPGDPIVGQEQEGSYHLSAQAQQLHDMFADGDSLDAEVRDKISSAAKSIEEAFKAITYDKQNPRGR